MPTELGAEAAFQIKLLQVSITRHPVLCCYFWAVVRCACQLPSLAVLPVLASLRVHLDLFSLPCTLQITTGRNKMHVLSVPRTFPGRPWSPEWDVKLPPRPITIPDALAVLRSLALQPAFVSGLGDIFGVKTAVLPPHKADALGRLLTDAFGVAAALPRYSDGAASAGWLSAGAGGASSRSASTSEDMEGVCVSSALSSPASSLSTSPARAASTRRLPSCLKSVTLAFKEAPPTGPLATTLGKRRRRNSAELGTGTSCLASSDVGISLACVDGTSVACGSDAPTAGPPCSPCLGVSTSGAAEQASPHRIHRAASHAHLGGAVAPSTRRLFGPAADAGADAWGVTMTAYAAPASSAPSSNAAAAGGSPDVVALLHAARRAATAAEGSASAVDAVGVALAGEAARGIRATPRRAPPAAAMPTSLPAADAGSRANSGGVPTCDPATQAARVGSTVAESPRTQSRLLLRDFSRSQGVNEEADAKLSMDPSSSAAPPIPPRVGAFSHAPFTRDATRSSGFEIASTIPCRSPLGSSAALAARPAGTRAAAPITSEKWTSDLSGGFEALSMHAAAPSFPHEPCTDSPSRRSRHASAVLASPSPSLFGSPERHNSSRTANPRIASGSRARCSLGIDDDDDVPERAECPASVSARPTPMASPSTDEFARPPVAPSQQALPGTAVVPGQAEAYNHIHSPALAAKALLLTDDFGEL